MKHPHSLSVLAAHVPACTIGQAGRIWGMSYRSAALKLGDFERSGLVRSVSFATRFFERPSAPLYVHEPKTEIVRERCRELSTLFRSRYRRTKVVPLRMFAVTTKTLNILGCVDVKPSTPMTASHDLLVTEVYLANRHRGIWKYEPEPPEGRRKFEKQPDAGLFGQDGTPDVFIEIAGSYRAERLAALMEFSNGSGVPLEFWQ